ncbi:MAG: hypothetical protein M3N98_15865, partial [Actinomycetota bacterium]|nr:hypothetical protein [Actinomycetota bacterium]
MSDPAAELAPVMVDVHLVALPVPLWARAQEWGDELTREFTLIAAGLREQGSHTEVPVRLIELIDALTARYGHLNVAQEAQLAAAAESGQEAIDELVFHAPDQAGEATVQL